MANTPVDILDSEEIEFEVSEGTEAPIIFGTDEYVSVLDYPRYDGSTQITPTAEPQTLATENTVLRSNIIVDAVPSQFVDISDTTAVASDVSSGKLFHDATGMLIEGSAANLSLKSGVIRPDAELWKSWSYNKLIIADEGKTKPSYTTVVTTLKSSSTIETVELDLDNYDYAFLIKTLAAPIYNTTNKSGGRFAYCAYVRYACIDELPANMVLLNGKTNGVRLTDTSQFAKAISVNWSGSTSINAVLGTNPFGCYAEPYGFNFTPSTRMLSIASPRFMIRGNSTYYSQTYWNYTTDVRYQYVIELYRTKKNNSFFDGYSIKSMLVPIILAAKNTDGIGPLT